MPIPVALSPVRLSSFGLKREAPIPASELTAEFEARFDSDTFLYDVFLDVEARCVTAIAAPFMNCAPAFDAARFRLGAHGPALKPHVHLHRKVVVVRLPVPAGAQTDVLQIEMNGRAVTVPVRPSLCHDLADRRIVFLLSKDNPLPWIEDWVRYNVVIHRADAVLLYDNDSSIYDPATLESLLGSIEGLAAFAVVPWRYPFGPEQSQGTGWEHCYCQAGALEHVRWRFSRLGRGFLHSDVDELVVTEDGDSVFDHLDRSGLPCLTYGGRWVTAIDPGTPKARATGGRSGRGSIRHTDCLYLEDAPPYPNKWVVDPRAGSYEVEWRTHTVVGLPGAAAKAAEARNPMVEDVMFRHCRQISTNWKYARTFVPRLREGMTYDEAFARTLARAFPERSFDRQ